MRFFDKAKKRPPYKSDGKNGKMRRKVLILVSHNKTRMYRSQERYLSSEEENTVNVEEENHSHIASVPISSDLRWALNCTRTNDARILPLQNTKNTVNWLMEIY